MEGYLCVLFAADRAILYQLLHQPQRENKMPVEQYLVEVAPGRVAAGDKPATGPEYR